MTAILKYFDAFDKSSNPEVRAETRSVSLIVIASIAVLIVFRIILFFFSSADVTRQLTAEPSYIDPSESINISLSIFVFMPCYYLHFDSLDSLGFVQTDLRSKIKFLRYTRDTKYIGPANRTLNFQCFPCFGILPEGTCNDCSQLKLLFKNAGQEPDPDNWPQCRSRPSENISSNEKCLIKGKFSANKIKGSFHISPGRNHPTRSKHIHDMNFQFPHFNLSHQIQKLSFGTEIPSASLPLKNSRYFQPPELPVLHSYILSATPLVYVKNERLVHGYEYQSIVNRQVAFIEQGFCPGIFFQYSFSPFTVAVHDSGYSLIRTITSTAGFLAGLFAIGSFFDAFRSHKDVPAAIST